MTMELFGQVLPPVALKFNRASRFATDYSARNGIKRHGPFDASLFPQSEIVCGLLYPRHLSTQRDTLVRALTEGDGINFPGFSPWFKAHLTFDTRCERAVAQDSALPAAASAVAVRSPDLIFIIADQTSSDTYKQCKSILLSNGIPCQFIIASKLQNPNQRPWIVSNIALASYAKVGGTPWVVAESSGRQELVMGVSRAQDISGAYVVGFVTLFNQDGDFLLLHSKSPVVQWADYVRGLETLIIDAYRQYEQDFGAAQSLVIHFHKRPGFQEIDAVNKALSNLGRTIPYALLHLNEFSAFRLFNTAHGTYVPPSGLTVNMGQRRALLLLDGLENGKRPRIGVPNVWDISLDKRSTLDVSEFPRLVRQIHRFSKVNWRGFNAKSVPVSTNYSKLICDQVLDIGLSSWNSMIGSGRLRDKAWFL